MLGEMLSVNHSQTFSFFLDGLQETTKKEPCSQMLYVASVLAHYAQTPQGSHEYIAFRDLGDMVGQAVFVEVSDPEILQIYGSHIILFAGFFRDQVGRRHNVGWYDQLGQRFYYRVGRYSSSAKERDFFGDFAEVLPQWTHRCCRLSRYLREKRLLIRMDQ
jgi:hypothetical protein